MDRKRSSAHSSGNGSSKPLSREALRKANHSMIERRRREKINHAFSELRGMVPGLGGGGEGMKGEFKLEVLEKTVEHMRALMNRLDVLESQTSRKTSQQVEEAKPGRKRKRLASSPTTTTTSSSSNPVVVPGRSRQPISKSDRRPLRRVVEKPGVSEESSESSDEEPLVGRFLPKNDETKTEVRATPLPLPIPTRSNIITTSPIPPNTINSQSHTHDHNHNPTHTRTHHTPVSFHLPLSRILNPSSPKRQPKLLPPNTFNSPTPSRTDSEATVLEEGLPSPGSDSGLGLGMVDGIAVRLDTIGDDRMIMDTGRGDSEQPTPISSLALGHHQPSFQYNQNQFQSSTPRYPFPASATLSTSSTTDRNKKDLFLSTSTEMSPLSPFIIGTSSSYSSSLSRSKSNNNPNRRSSPSQIGHMFLPEPSPLLTPMIQRQSLTGLFELDPLSLPLALERGSSAEDEGDNDINPNVPPDHAHHAATGRPSTQVDEQEAANILLALSSPESMAPTPWHSASKGASPPSGFSLDVIEEQGPVEAEDGMTMKMDTDKNMDVVDNMDVERKEGDVHPVNVPRTSSVTSSARGGRLAKSARDFLNLRDDAFGFALTHVG